jgi:hypothetical protein
MAITYNPRIVTDGLVLCLDPGNVKGYDKYENLTFYSSEIGRALTYASGGIVGLNTSATTAPNGLYEASSLDNNGNTGTNYTYGGAGVGLSTNTTYTYSIHIKQGTKPDFQITIDENGFGGKRYYSIFTYSTETVTSGITGGTNDGVVVGSSVTKYSNGWYRLSLTFRTSTTNVNGFVDMINRFGNTSGSNYVWGRQLERGIDATDYYPITGGLKIRGTTLSDLSGGSNNGTLTNIPTYSNANGGYLIYASANSQYATAINPGSLSRWTVETVVRFTASYSNKVAMVVGGQYNGVSSLNFAIGTNNAPTNYNIAVGFFDGAWRNTTGIAYAQNTWFHITGTYDGSAIRQFTNGTQVDSLNYTGTPTSGGEIRINRRWDDIVSSGNLFDSNIAMVRIYNRALSTTEITQNFNALRGRYGI